MPLEIVPATEADLLQSIAIEKRAYGPNKTSPVFFPGEGMSDEDRIAIMTRRRDEEPACQWMKIVDTDLEAKGENGMVAFTLWFIWSGDLRPSFPERKWGAGTNVEACDAFFGEMDRRWWKRFEGKPHVYLKLLHTDPVHQRRGAGSMCLRWGAAEADRLGLVSYLEASEEGRLLYEKHGYKEVDRITVDLSKWGTPIDATTYLMIREPVLN
ncbi:hypothetical protein TARUN_647 [Trichoderma arundinaceum]|uniref:N-acetyltransferase domain-containing protein n=1 Tax=Trichoderma arundinaceum TaxID=490622 RepID=A0A395NZY2_TRIAR|nr:hypothetical protein TARUN_647 [Trichoderma arundinaceum]